MRVADSPAQLNLKTISQLQRLKIIFHPNWFFFFISPKTSSAAIKLCTHKKKTKKKVSQRSGDKKSLLIFIFHGSAVATKFVFDIAVRWLLQVVFELSQMTSGFHKLPRCAHIQKIRSWVVYFGSLERTILSWRSNFSQFFFSTTHKINYSSSFSRSHTRKTEISLKRARECWWSNRKKKL